jgi:hypothetical protein
LANWYELINGAARQGYAVEYRDDWAGWIIITPAAPRRASQELGAFKDERGAWRDAARLAANTEEPHL